MHRQDTRAQYEIVRTTDDIIFIEDVGHARTTSVTNDAEAVVYEIVNNYGNKRVVYQDSMGSWDELLHTDGRFTGFGPYRK